MVALGWTEDDFWSSTWRATQLAIIGFDELERQRTDITDWIARKQTFHICTTFGSKHKNYKDLWPHSWDKEIETPSVALSEEDFKQHVERMRAEFSKT